MKQDLTVTEKKTAEELHILLNEIAGGLEELYDCLRRQQEALVKWNLSAFNKTIRQQNRLANENLERDKKRIELMDKISWEEDGEKKLLRSLAERLGGSWPERFEKTADRIREASNKTIAMKEQNESIINYSKTLVNDQIRLILELARINRNLYEGSGKKSIKANMYKVLDKKI